MRRLIRRVVQRVRWAVRGLRGDPLVVKVPVVDRKDPQALVREILLVGRAGILPGLQLLIADALEELAKTEGWQVFVAMLARQEMLNALDAGEGQDGYSIEWLRGARYAYQQAYFMPAIETAHAREIIERIEAQKRRKESVEERMGTSFEAGPVG